MGPDVGGEDRGGHVVVGRRGMACPRDLRFTSGRNKLCQTLAGPCSLITLRKIAWIG